MKSLRTKLTGIIFFLILIMQISTVVSVHTQNTLDNQNCGIGSPTYIFGQGPQTIVDNTYAPTRYEYFPVIVEDSVLPEIESENKMI